MSQLIHPGACSKCGHCMLVKGDDCPGQQHDDRAFAFRTLLPESQAAFSTDLGCKARCDSDSRL